MERLPFVVSIGFVLVAIAWTETADDRDLAAWEDAHQVRIAPLDLVFQDLVCGERCELIRDVTGGRYVHVGIVLEDDGERFVWEALGPVGPTPLAEFLERGRDRLLAVYRPRPSLVLHARAIERAIRSYRGRPYDADYQRDDARIYCSELVAKAYRDVLGRDLIPPHRIALGVNAARIAHMSHGRLTSRTEIVTPRDLTESGGFVRLVDELR